MPLIPTPLSAQVDAATADPLRVLVVGAGMAGLTAAQLLRGAGVHPILIDRIVDASHPGYMLALMPMIDAAIDELGVREAYRQRSVEFTRYRARGHTGRVLRTDSLAEVLERYGEYRGIDRGALIETLSHAGAPATFGATATDLREGSDAVDVVLQEGEQTVTTQVDLVVVADGIGSRTRALLPGGRHTTGTDTGWGGWVVWTPEDDVPDLGEELWSAGFFLGIYPVLGRSGVFLGGPHAATGAGPEAFVARVRDRLTSTSPRVERALQAVVADPDPYYWPLRDVRAARWTTPRTVLLGDAAAGFLPTAGIGAGMAIESAWVLTTMLRSLLPTAEAGRAGPLPAPVLTPAGRVAGVELAKTLTQYERRHRSRVQTAQDTSRNLARWMFSESRPLAVLRDLAFRLVSVGVAIRPIVELLAHPPGPSAAAGDAPPAGRQVRSAR